MRVCFITHSNCPWSPYYARYFQERGHEVSMISFHPKEIPGVAVYYVGTERATGDLPKWLYLWRVLRVRRLLRRLQPDVVMAAYLRSNGLIGALTKQCALVVSTRGVDQSFPLPFGLGRRLTRWVANRADLLHASSPELAECLEAVGVPRHRITVQPLGTDATVFAPRTGPRPEGPPRIICTRKHEPLYDNKTIVRALAILRDEGMRYQARFVGTGSAIQESKSLAAELQLADRVQFVDEVEHDRIPEMLRWADVYVSAALADGASSSLFEAMSAKLFPVVTDVRANRDWLAHRQTGWLFAAGNSRQCAEGLRWAFDNLERVAKALEANRQVVIDQCDRAAGLARLERLLERAIEMHRRDTASHQN